MNKERRYELYSWVIDKFYDRESIASIQIAARDLFKEHQLNSIEEMMFLEDLACELHHVIMSYLVVDKPDATDIWRENLKAWSLKQREEKPAFTLSVGELTGVSVEDMAKNFNRLQDQLCSEYYPSEKRKEFFTDDLQKAIEDYDKVTERAHYKGEF